MKKKLIVAAIAAFAAAGISVSAQQPAPGTCCAETQCTAQNDCKRPCPFDGLDLTDAQRAQLKELQKQCVEQTKANKDKDKAARREAAKQRRAEKLAKIKEILTPEQYIKFLENQYLNAHNKVKGDFRKGRQAFNKERNKMRSDRKVLDKSAKELMKKKESKK